MSQTEAVDLNLCFDIYQICKIYTEKAQEALLEHHVKEELHFVRNFCLDHQYHISSASFTNFGCETWG
jgi:hypothetical protein